MLHGVTFNFGSAEVCSPAILETCFSYDKVTVFFVINAPSLLIAPPPPPPSSLPLQSSYFGVLHPSQQPTLLRFRDSEKWCILVLPKRISLTRNKENKNKTW